MIMGGHAGAGGTWVKYNSSTHYPHAIHTLSERRMAVLAPPAENFVTRRPSSDRVMGWPIC